MLPPCAVAWKLPLDSKFLLSGIPVLLPVVVQCLIVVYMLFLFGSCLRWEGKSSSSITAGSGSSDYILVSKTDLSGEPEPVTSLGFSLYTLSKINLVILNVPYKDWTSQGFFFHHALWAHLSQQSVIIALYSVDCMLRSCNWWLHLLFNVVVGIS